MWLLATKAMLADRGKLLTSLLGVAFSVVLINLQGGLLIGLIQKASLLVDYGQADIWVGHQHMNNVDIGIFIPERWVQRIRAVEGVERAEPYVVMFGQSTMPDGRYENVLVVGCEPASLMGNAWTNGIVGFTTNPYIFTTLERARKKYTVGIPPEHCSYFLVKAKPGTDIKELCSRIRERVPELDVYDRGTYSLMCMEYWLTRTGIGISFGLAAFLGLLVGLAVVAQTLYASVNERIKEFGTLKAMGADDRCVSRFLVSQALGTAALGSVIGLVGMVLLGRSLSSPRAPVVLTWGVAICSVALIAMVCLLAVWLPYWRVRRIDPASVLRS
jgi:putative ABC transport system permease protein